MHSGKLAQPWAIGVIDTCSRVVMAFEITLSVPSTADVLRTVRTAILPKDDSRFPFFGCPKKIQTDNGSIFRSADFLDALLRLDIGLVETPKNCPSADGKIERLFKTINDGFLRNLSQFAHQHRGMALAKRYPLPLPVLLKMAPKFIADYHLRLHRGLGTSPWEKWHGTLENAEGFSIDADAVFEAFKIRIERRVGRDGVEVSPGLHLSAPELAGLVGETVYLRVLPEGGDGRVECYYRGEYLASLVAVEGNGHLIESIREARRARAIELNKLRHSLIKSAERILSPQPHLSAHRDHDEVHDDGREEDLEIEEEIPQLREATDFGDGE